MTKIEFSEVFTKGEGFETITIKKVLRNMVSMGYVRADLKEEELPGWIKEDNIRFGKKRNGDDPGLGAWSYREVFLNNNSIGRQSLDPQSGEPLSPFLW